MARELYKDSHQLVQESHIYDAKTLIELHGPVEKQLQPHLFKYITHPSLPDRLDVLPPQGVERVTLRGVAAACMMLVPTVGFRDFVDVETPGIFPADTITQVLERIQISFDPRLLDMLPPVSERTGGPPSVEDYTENNALFFALTVDPMSEEEWRVPIDERDRLFAQSLEESKSQMTKERKSKKKRKRAEPQSDVERLLAQNPIDAVKADLARYNIDTTRVRQDPHLVPDDRVLGFFPKYLRKVTAGQLRWIPMGLKQLEWEAKGLAPVIVNVDLVLTELAPWDRFHIRAYARRVCALGRSEHQGDELAAPGRVYVRNAYNVTPKRPNRLTSNMAHNVIRGCTLRSLGLSVFDFKGIPPKHLVPQPRPSSQGHGCGKETDIEDMPLKVVRPWACTNCRKCDSHFDITEEVGQTIITVESFGVYDPWYIFQEGLKIFIREHGRKVFFTSAQTEDVPHTNEERAVKKRKTSASHHQHKG